MKRKIFGVLGLTVAAGFVACSGISTQTPLPDGGSQLGGGGQTALDASAGGAGDAPILDAGSAGDGPAVDAGKPSLVGCLNDADCREGVCDANLKQCVECRVDSSCDQGERCKEGRCVDARPCTPGSYACDGQTLFHCSPDAELEFSRDCAKNEYCDQRRAQCQPQICKPGSASCDGAKVQVCNDDGSEFVPKRLCSLSQVCSDGDCLDIVCVPNSSFCKDGSIWRCGADGASSEPTEHCAAGRYCLEKDHSATCSATVCFAGDAMCVGNSATQCKPDGSGPKPGGTDCASANQLCYEGECRDPVCTPGQKLCDGNRLYLCSEAGTGKTLITECGDQASCDAATGTCVPRICEAGKLSCDGTRVVTCNPEGTAWLQSGPDCAASHALCAAGSCKPIICTPGQLQCKDDDVYQCNADGTGVVIYNDCNSTNYHCVTSGTYAYCSLYYCMPNSVGCNGSLLTTCKADGSGWVAGGTDCASSGAACSGNQCKPKICTAAALFCQSDSVVQCDSQGLNWYQSKLCGYGSYCKAQGNTADCFPTPCVPDSDGCLAEKYGHCSSDGMSQDSGATDCAASSKVCTGLGCAATAIDTIASTNAVGAYNYSTFVNFLDVRSSRKLTEIEVYLSLPAPRTLTFVVFQKSAVSQTSYELKFQKAMSASGSGFQSSGAISYKLEAGKSYAIGVNVSTGSAAFYYDTSLSPPSLSFASVLGGHYYGNLTSSIYPFPNLSLIHHQRLTTTLP